MSFLTYYKLIYHNPDFVLEILRWNTIQLKRESARVS
jgi:hypothetical protein